MKKIRDVLYIISLIFVFIFPFSFFILGIRSTTTGFLFVVLMYFLIFPLSVIFLSIGRKYSEETVRKTPEGIKAYKDLETSRRMVRILGVLDLIPLVTVLIMKLCEVLNKENCGDWWGLALLGLPVWFFHLFTIPHLIQEERKLKKIVYS